MAAQFWQPRDNVVVVILGAPTFLPAASARAQIRTAATRLEHALCGTEAFRILFDAAAEGLGDHLMAKADAQHEGAAAHVADESWP